MSVAVEQLPVAVGQRVREARARRAWTLDQFADRSGVSRRMIVNVESGASNASITTLLRLASALEVPLADLVAERDESMVVLTHPGEREPLWHGAHGGSASLVASATVPDVLEMWEWVLEPGEEYTSEAHRPGTHELLHVLAGALVLTVDGEDSVVRAGSSASFAADVAHAYACAGRRGTRFMMTVLEPMARVRP